MEPGSPATDPYEGSSIRPDSMLGRYGEVAAAMREGSERFTSDEELGSRRRPATRG